MAAVNTTGTSTGVFDPWLSNKHWAGATLTYSFPTDGSTYGYMATGEVTPLSASQQAATRRVLDDIAGFTGLSFVEVTESAAAPGDLRFATDIRDPGAYAFLPSSIEQGGDAFFGTVTDNPQIGNESYLYFTHELGHSMGLNHGHEYPVFAGSDMNSQEFTILTYTDYIGDTDTFLFDSGPIDWAQSYMQLDIAAMQFLYGANYASTGELWSGDTTYTFNPQSGEMAVNGAGQGAPAGNRIFRTIWDGDGDDTYDLANYDTDLRIDLAPGGWSVFSDAQLADLNRNAPDPAYYARGNVANAQLAEGDIRGLIENATGGSGDDTILGNETGNRLQGGGGRDILKGKSGADTLVGNLGRDKLLGGLGGDTLNGGNGRDKLVGNKGADILIGGKGGDRLLGGDGKDELRGKIGNDMLDGGKGKDIMFGGSGADTFRFQAVDESRTGASSDVIKDFTSGTDRLDLSGLTSGTLSLSIGGAFSGTGASAITKLVNGDTRVLVDVDGDAGTDFRVILEATGAVAAGDFIL